MHYYFLVVVLIFVGNVESQNYLWPTNASPYISSSFCEYRPNHYHAAIDIKTWNQEGYPCYAVEDGYIERIKISPFGAGKALYIRLNDGRKAVYFHLQKFDDKLEQKIREIQLDQKKYSIEWWPKNLTVKKGETVAYTGQTGIGVPHLHFEIRDSHDNPLNPLRFYNSVKDNIRPSLNELLIIPQNEKSLVNGSFVPKKYSLSYIKNGVYVIKEPVYAQGLIGLAVDGFDQANEVSNKYSFYKQEMLAEGKLVFQKAYDRMSFSSTRMIDLDIYYPEKVNSNKIFNTLYIEPQNTLGFYNRNLGNGLIDIGTEKIPIEIHISDFAGNTSIIKTEIIPQSMAPLILEKKNNQPESVFLKVNIPDSLKNLQFYSGTSLQDLQQISYYEIVERNIEPSIRSFLVKLNPARFGDSLIQSVIENTQGVVSQTSTRLRNVQKNKVHLNSRLMGKYLYLAFANIEGPAAFNLEIEQKGKSKSTKIILENGRAEYILPARYLAGDSVKIELSNREITWLDTTLFIRRMLPDKQSIHAFFDDSLQVQATGQSAYDTLLFRAEKISRPEFIEDIPVYGSSYKIDNGGRILDRRAYVSIKRDRSFYKPEQCGIYEINKNKLDFLGGEYNFDTGFITAGVNSFGKYLLAADTLAPKVNIIKPVENRTYKETPVVLFKLEDNLSKIGTDENIEILLDGQFIVPEWDPERDLVSGNIHFKLHSGQHVAEIKVRDRARNISEKKVTFFIQ